MTLLQGASLADNMVCESVKENYFLFSSIRVSLLHLCVKGVTQRSMSDMSETKHMLRQNRILKNRDQFHFEKNTFLAELKKWD